MPPAPPQPDPRPEGGHPLDPATPLRPGLVEGALERASRYLVARSGAGVEGVLRVLGDALEADSVYFVAASEPPQGGGDPPVSPVPSYILGCVFTWTRDDDQIRESPASDVRAGGGPDVGALAVPVLTDDEQFVGYLGIERSALGDPVGSPYGRALSVIGDVLGAHLGRLASEEARERTEQRWRHLVEGHPDPTLVVVGGAVSYANRAAAELLGVAAPDGLVGRPLDDFLSAEDVGNVSALREAQLTSARPAPFEHAVIRTDGDVRRVESVSVPFPGVEGGHQTVLRDLTERRESEERYRTFVQTITEGAWRIRIAPPLNRAAPLHAQADHLLDHGRFVELNPAMVRILAPSRVPPIGAPLRDLLGPYGSAVAWSFAESGHELRAHELSIRPPKSRRVHLLVNAVGRSERDALVEVWGSCNDITDRVEMERRMVSVLEDQQQRIGRDLHDSVGQLLTGVRMLSEGLAEAGGPQAETATRIAQYAGEALDRVRAICHGLVPLQLYSEGAAGAIAELVEHADALGRARCVFRLEGAVDVLDPEAALQAYRVAQEALSNALRHAGAETVWVHLGQDGPDVVLEVEDDGVGFELHGNRARSLGLYGMARRAHSVGGDLSVETAPGAGTTIRLRFPATSPGHRARGGEH